MLWGIYSAIYGEVNVSVEKCVEIAKLFYFCYHKKLVSAIYALLVHKCEKCVEIKGDYGEK